MGITDSAHSVASGGSARVRCPRRMWFASAAVRPYGTRATCNRTGLSDSNDSKPLAISDVESGTELEAK